jgi:starvation-inducible outer membrane lipoprotein
MVARLILLTLLLAGCTTAPRGSFCDIEHPTRLSPATVDAMTDTEVAAALAHNRKGAALCGWKP